jgi:3-methylcrotonyl-CoA carboxylase alpha subunit
LPLAQDEVHAQGHALELRLYAEDPEQNFLPGSGRLERLVLPRATSHVRVDTGVAEGDLVSIFYDPMIAKVIVHDRTRALALERMREALAATGIVGPKSNVEFLERLVRHPAVVDGSIDTGYLDRHLAEFLPDTQQTPLLALFAAAAAALLEDEAEARAVTRRSSDPHSPWGEADGWRHGHRGKRLECFSWRGQRLEVAAHGSAGDYRLDLGEQHLQVSGARLDGVALSARFDGVGRRFGVFRHRDTLVLHDGAERQRFEREPAYAVRATASKGGDRIVAPMPGRVVAVRTAPGAEVAEGQELVIMEAMKMELTLRAPRAGKIESVQAEVGEFVEADAVLVRFVKE